MHGMILFLLLITFLWLGRSILIPLLVAVFLWYLINAIAAYYRKVMPYQKPRDKKSKILSRIFDWTSLALALGTICGLIYLFATQVRPMFRELLLALPEIQHKLVELGDYISKLIGLRFDASIVPNITRFAANVGASVAGIATSMGMILIYVFFMFIEQGTFNEKFQSLFTSRTQSRKMRYILSSIDNNMKKYLFMKTFISGITGISSYFWLQIIGLPFAGVWAFIIFVANYIPTIGSFIACSMPIIYALSVGPGLQLPLLTAAGLIGIQILFGNIIEPKLTGKTLNLSTLAILINLVFWGMVWGVAGMFFSVPLLVAILIITAQFDSTRWIAVLLSADGKIPNKSED